MTRSRPGPWWPLAIAAIAAWGCAGEEAKGWSGCSGDPCRTVIDIDPREVVVSMADLEPGATASARVTITNTGTRDLHVTSVGLSYEPPGNILESTPAILLVDDLPELPLTLFPLGISDDQRLVLTFVITRPADELARSATLRIESDDHDAPVIWLPIRATHAPVPRVPCPVPVLTVDEGGEVGPLTTLHLHGHASYSDNGAVTAYAWTVESPGRDPGTFVPSSSHPSPTYQVTATGTYVFHLYVWDEIGNQSCEGAEAVVEVSAD